MIVAVTGGKGGAGATVLAINLARAWADSGRPTLLLDLDPLGGDVAAYLDPENLDPRRGLLPLLKLSTGAPTAEALGHETQEVRPNLSVLLGILRPAPELLDGRASELVRTARTLAEHVVVDIGVAIPGSPSLQALHTADRVLLAARPDLQGALATERVFAVMPDDIRTTLVATRVRRRKIADVAELSEALGRRVTLTTPEDHRNASSPRRQRRRMRRALERLVADLYPVPMPQPVVAPAAVEEAART